MTLSIFWLDQWMDGWTYIRMGGQAHRRTDGQTNAWIDKRLINKRMDERMQGQTYAWTDEHMDRGLWIVEASMDRQ